MHTQEQTRATDNPLSEAILARRPLRYVETWEEERLIELVRTASNNLFDELRPLWIWSATRGFLTGPGRARDFSDPFAALKFILESSAPTTYLMLDLPAFSPPEPGLVACPA